MRFLPRYPAKTARSLAAVLTAGTAFILSAAGATAGFGSQDLQRALSFQTIPSQDDPKPQDDKPDAKADEPPAEEDGDGKNEDDGKDGQEKDEPGKSDQDKTEEGGNDAAADQKPASASEPTGTPAKNTPTKSKPARKTPQKKSQFRSIASVIKGHKKFDGLFPLYQDPETGRLRMEIREDQLDREFIYFSHVMDGVVEGGHFRGQYRQQKIIRINRYFNRIEFVEENPFFYFDPDNPLARARDANISPAILAVARIEAASSEEGAEDTPEPSEAEKHEATGTDAADTPSDSAAEDEATAPEIPEKPADDRKMLASARTDAPQTATTDPETGAEDSADTDQQAGEEKTGKDEDALEDTATTPPLKRYLIRADGLFASEALDQIKPSRAPGQKSGDRFGLGKLSSAKTKISAIGNYPENTAVTADYVYTNPQPPAVGTGLEITDPRNVTVRVQHTLLRMPDDGYSPRLDDPRVGYFLNYVNDMTSTDVTPWRDMINRWRLVKKDPQATLSEPVKPIVWWVENTTPEDLRPVIVRAVESWNIAFEAAGFRNAIQVRIQPDDADWDAGDIRYNVIRWTASPTPAFTGYGPSFTNPRTGEILGADIMLEYSFFSDLMRVGRSFDLETYDLATMDFRKGPSGARIWRPNGGASGHTHTHHNPGDAKGCTISSHLRRSVALGKTLAATLKGGNSHSDRLLEEALYYLVIHEVGHTLGLTHNMKGSFGRPYASAHDILAQGGGLVGSVMDYPAVNIAPPGEPQAYFYTTRPGPYDVWAVQFGYDTRLDDPDIRRAHLERSSDPALAFGNDADDMSIPGKGVDPRVNVFDFSDDPVRYAADRLELDRQAMARLMERYQTNGDESYQGLRNAFLTIAWDMLWQGRVVSRYIGGVYVDRATPGQPGATAPYRPVAKSVQKQAMGVLTTGMFAPDAFDIDGDLARHLAIQRRGFRHYFGTEDPKLHDMALGIQADILAHLLHPFTLRRMTDTGLYGNDYSVPEMMGDLTGAIFDTDSRGAVNTMRQGLQHYYVDRLIGVFGSVFYDEVARSSALGNLRRIRRSMDRWRGDAATRAHRDHIAFKIDRALETGR
ncbi:zinc-dependent metalloprotease [Eilatimonas milleporae]|uniref:Uncharacterized protein DUF5117 n=1 Tax=Eilatimonas milleporae TaxID=911205 RepID=A0A3M0C6B4_9PROT|nr:zinc-dependent metalloprotease [Eilatimonas milleporae]RMB04445.1 uncharacterized protein DUF5117 [Eilatimonas milleporae]